MCEAIRPRLLLRNLKVNHLMIGLYVCFYLKGRETTIPQLYTRRSLILLGLGEGQKLFFSLGIDQSKPIPTSQSPLPEHKNMTHLLYLRGNNARCYSSLLNNIHSSSLMLFL